MESNLVKSKLFQMEYYDTYFFANLLFDMLSHTCPYQGVLDDFCDAIYLKNLSQFQKYSVLHVFTEFVIKQFTYEQIDDVIEDALVHDEDFELWVNSALNHYGIEHISFDSWLYSKGIFIEDISEQVITEYHEHLYNDGPFEDLLEHLSEEIFFLMFMNREFLRNFNRMLAAYVSKLKIKGLKSHERDFFKKDGVLKRARIPVWARRAVFYRDRGLCGSCQRDISGLVSIHSDKHFDHMVPLAVGGVNDVTNLQLLCGRCNLRKQHKHSDTSKYYEKWYM
jgi:hypothetical protein